MDKSYFLGKIEEILDISLQASEAILDLYDSETNLETEYKVTESDGFVSPLTRADKTSHEIIIAGLKTSFPDLLVVSEEQAADLNTRAVESGTYFIIDPIDGTKGFINKDGNFTVNIGVIQHGEPILGVVQAPAQNIVYYTDIEGAKVKKNGVSTPIHVAANRRVNRIVASKNHLDEITKEFIRQFEDVELVKAGSSIKICAVASGEADMYPRLQPTTMEWDTAAADAVLRAAGGKMLQSDTKRPLKYGKLPELRNPGFLADGSSASYSIPAPR